MEYKLVKTLEDLLQLIGKKTIKVKRNGSMYDFAEIEIFNSKLATLMMMIKNKELHYETTRFSDGDKVKVNVSKKERKGSIGVVEKQAISMDKISYWVNFGDHNSWINEDELILQK